MFMNTEYSQNLRSHAKYSGGERSTLETNPKLSSVLDVKVFSDLGSSKTPRFNETVLLGWVSPILPLLFSLLLSSTTLKKTKQNTKTQTMTKTNKTKANKEKLLYT